MNLTEIEFWDKYWSRCKLPVTVDPNFSFDRCVAKKLKELLCGTSGSVLEIGCAPGKWLSFIAQEVGLLPSGIEYSEVGVSATKKNFDTLGVEYGELWSGDFFEAQPLQLHDVVLSLGFIEHFDDPDAVIGRHLDWLKPGGKLVLGVPNFSGVYGPIQRVLDKSLLEKHNTDIMSPKYFRRVEKLFGLKMEYLGYLGSFEPDLPIPKTGSMNAIQFLTRAFLSVARRVRRLNILDRVNHPYISSYIMAAYEKGE